MKYYEKSKNLRKTDRKNAIILMRQSGKTYQEIADYFGITRQRIHQIIKDYSHVYNLKSIKTFNDKHNVCEICGSEEKLHTHHIDRNRRNNGHENLMRICQSCHYKIHEGRKVGVYYSKKKVVDNLENKHKKRLLTRCKEFIKIR